MRKSLQKVFQCAGCALFSAQMMERELACLLLIPRIRMMGEMSAESEIQETIDKFDRMTFGKLIKELNALGDMGDLASKLQDVLKNRNRLAHHFFETYQKRLDDPAAHVAMKDELSEMKKSFDETFNAFHGVNARLMRELGICTENGDLVEDD